MGRSAVCDRPDGKTPDAAGAVLSFRTFGARRTGFHRLLDIVYSAARVVLDRRARPETRTQVRRIYGVPVKDYIHQSQEFTLCAVALAYPIITLLRAKRILLAVLLIALSLSLVVNMMFVIVSRTALVTMPIMLAEFALFT